MSEYRYLVSYNFSKKEFSSELNREITTYGFGEMTFIIKGSLTSSKIDKVRTKIIESNDFSVVVILNIIRLEKVIRKGSE